jgi:hypothetical protein
LAVSPSEGSSVNLSEPYRLVYFVLAADILRSVVLAVADSGHGVAGLKAQAEQEQEGNDSFHFA